MLNYDLVIIGGGTAGYSAAIRAIEHGLKVLIIEKDKLGGTCLHKGCIPTKALNEASRAYANALKAPSFGINAKDISYDWQRIMQYKSGVVGDLYEGLKSLIKTKGIDVIKGNASFVSQDTVIVDDKKITAANFIIATGAKPKEISKLIKSNLIVDSDKLLDIEDIPKKLIIVGGGYIGIEFASIFNEFGSEVRVIELAPDILMGNDSDLRKMLADKLQGRGIDIETGAVIENVQEKDNRLEVVVDGERVPRTYIADKLLVAVGREANIFDIGLENAGIDIKDGFIAVNHLLMTSAQNIYAIGDCINTPQLAHVSFSEGLAVADYIATKDAVFPYYQAIPKIVYSRPELASVGQTEDETTSAGIKIKSAYFGFRNNSKAVISQEPEGVCKIVADKFDNVLGVHILGPGASDLISEAMIAVGWEAKVKDIANFIHPHPTLSEVIGETALKLSGKPLHSA